MESEASGLVRYSTRDAAASPRGHPTIEDVYANFTRMNIASADDSPLDVNMSLRFLPDVSIATISTSPYKIERTHAQSVDGNDGFTLTLSRRYGIAAQQPGREAEIDAEEAYLWRNDMGMTAVAAKGENLINIAVPRNMVVPAVNDIDSVLKDIVPASVPLKLLALYAEGLMVDAPLPPETAALAASHLRDLIVSALEPKPVRGNEPGGLRAARLAAIKRDVLERLADPDLSLETVAARHRISKQYVRALFRHDGTAFSDYIRGQRLRRAFRLLTDLRMSHLPICAIAYDCGFGDLSWFNKAFKRRFGQTPTDIRRAGQPDGSLFAAKIGAVGCQPTLLRDRPIPGVVSR